VEAYFLVQKLCGAIESVISASNRHDLHSSLITEARTRLIEIQEPFRRIAALCTAQCQDFVQHMARQFSQVEDFELRKKITISVAISVSDAMEKIISTPSIVRFSLKVRQP
jgi:hypothetical protein